MSYPAERFFDLPSDLARGLFAQAEYVWDAVKALPGYIERTIQPEILGEVEEGAWLEPGAVRLGRGSRVERGAIVRGPTVVGRNSVIRTGAYLRGHVRIGDECIIGHGVEMRQVLVLDGSSVPHTNCVFTSLIGNQVRVAGLAQFANYLLGGGEVTIKIKEDEQTRSYPTGQSLFGAVVGDGCNIGVMAVLQPGTILERGCVVYPQALVSGYYRARSRILPRRR